VVESWSFFALGTSRDIANLYTYLSLFLFILVTVIGGRPKPELCFLPGRLRWTLLPKVRYGDSLSGRGSNTQPSS